MAYAFGQEAAAPTTSAGSPAAATVTISLTGGRMGVALLTQSDSASGRLYTMVDSSAGAWTQVGYANPGRAVGIWVRVNMPSGLTSVTATANTGTSSFQLRILEFSGFGASVVTTNFDSLTGPSSTNHTCSAAGVTFAGACVAICCGVLNGVGTECTQGSGFTETPAAYADQQHLGQWQVLASATGEVGAWTNTSPSRVSVAAIALLYDTPVAFDPALLPPSRFPAMIARAVDVVDY